MPSRVRSPKYKAAAVELPSAPLRTAGGQAPRTPITLATPAGLGDNNNSIPPDTMGAVSDTGNNTMIVALNTYWAVYNKSGTLTSGPSANLATPLWNGVVPSAFDPKVHWDQASGRFVFVAMGRGTGGSPHNTSKLLIAVSKTGAPTTVANTWWTATFDADASCSPGPCTYWTDYPNVGVNGQWIVVTANIYLVSDNSFQGAKMWVFDKSAALGGDFATNRTIFNRCFDSGGPGSCDLSQAGFAMAPTIDYDQTDNAMYLVDSGWTDTGSPPYNNFLRVSKLTGTVGSPSWGLATTPSNSIGTGFIQVANYSIYPLPNVPQSGTAATVDPGDGRIINCVRRNGSLWTAHEGGLPSGGSPTRSEAFWYQLYVGASSVTLAQNGVVDGGSIFYFDPAISVDAFNNVALGMSGSSANQFIGAYYVGRRAAEAAGTMGTPVLYQAGSRLYLKTWDTGTPQRWGDYSAAMPDPSSSLTFWTLQQIAAPLGCGDGTGCWATQWAKFGIGVPAAVISTAAIVLGTSSITWTWSAVASADTYNIYNAGDSSLINAQGTLTLSPPSFKWTGRTSNTAYRIIIKGCSTELGGGSCVSPSTGEGDVALGPSAATFADAATAVSAAAFISSITVSFTASGNSSGYRVEASTAANFTGVLVSSSGASPGSGQSTKLSAIGLSQLTQYYLRVASLNPSSVANYTAASNSPQSTSGNLVAPATGAFPFNSTDTIRFSWTDPNNGSGLSYQAHASLTSNFASSATIAVTGYSADFHSLAVNTSYYFRVEVVGAPTMSTGPVSTLTLPPVASLTLSTYSNIGAAGLTVNWAGTGNPPGTLFQADVSTRSDLASAVVSSITYNSSATFAGLLSNSTYYARVASLNQASIPSVYLTLPSTSTLAAAPVTAAAYVTNLSNTGFSFYFYAQSDPPGTRYVARISTVSNFATVYASAAGSTQSGFSNPADTATFAGLLSNQTFYYRVEAINNNNIPAFSSSFSTATFPSLPVFASTGALSSTTNSLRPSWGTGPNAAGTLFTAIVSSDPVFASGNQSSTTANAYASYINLWANTPYYQEVKAKSAAPPDPDSAFADLGAAGTTLSNPPGIPAQPFVTVTYASVTAQWLPLPASPSSATGTGYVLQASTDANFAGTIFSNSFSGIGVTQGALGGLAYSTTYFMRVGALNRAGAPNFAVLGSTRTLVPQVSSAAVPGGGAAFSLEVVQPFPEIRSILVNIPASAFPAGTAVVLNTNVELELPPAFSNEAQIAFLGPAVGFSITAAGYQPNYPVSIAIQYNLAAGIDPNRLVLARYDADSGQWTLLPSQVNTTAQTLTGLTSHFSFFTPVLVQPGSGVDGVNIFPSPWEPGSDNSQLNSPTLNFSNLPGGATLKIFNITGELVWKAEAPASGTWSWTGENSNGKWVGTGSYLVVIESGGKRKVRRIAIVR